ncbi:3-hydroxyisobutyryl-CoA hydrolase [Amycolatopsis acidiphila]|uniref:3-hydroxyisobutyryl-CoA hydrolase n=2 Tax=Amycolatopsis acidiphila TaxID=715473 RepID=A0A558AFI8_9PSEU|nr:enoyl-CoA hydratase/isomerase family protein [Amycolatopsis acidiphila]UIJ63945.1 3-hydroxyisobutyryl-CoA hydrolase [Amycolatopsis acidiphila]GHG53059.1 putative enoyl-CoA hydratase [Amycolatopsis acidiphila]
MVRGGTVRCRREGVLGRITLDRPEALNALDLEMIQGMRGALDAWEDDSRVRAVVLDGAGDRAFCAGGDIAVVHRSARTDPGLARRLWRAEYRLDARLARYPKPVVAIMDGITMGGGMGIGCHAALRIVTERAVLAMPEVGIGLAPDVGGTLLLARAPGETGTHLALTGDRLTAADALYCGLADHFARSSEVPGLIAHLADGGTVEKHARAPEPPVLPGHRAWIDACYGGAGTVEEILRRLAARPEAAAADAARKIVAAAPTAVKVTLRAIRAARSMTGIEECLRQDYRLCSRFLAHPDLAEGIRAAIIDKDRRPAWRPAELAAVTPACVDSFFAPLEDDLVLP